MKSLWAIPCILLGINAVWAADLIEGVQALGRHDYVSALSNFRPLADGGDKSAQVKLGAMYQRGLGVQADDSTAFGWYQKAAIQGDPEGEVALGLMYQHGLGTQKDEVKAVEWFRRAADQGWPEGDMQLALAYEKGLGVPLDREQATEWLSKALNRSYPPAQAHAGYLALTGKNGPRDIKRAFALFHVAASRGDPFGDFYLSKMCFEGDGIAKDDVAAYALSIAAINQRDNYPDMTEQPEELLRKIKLEMSPAQLAEGKDLLRTRQDLINALDDRFARNHIGINGADAATVTGLPPIDVEIQQDGQLLLGHRAIDESSLIERLNMFFYMQPRPQLRVFIDMGERQSTQEQVVHKVMDDIGKIGWHDVAVEKY
jgi:uncharacterized protein